MYFTTKIKRFTDNKNGSESYVIQCHTYTEAELLVAKIFGDEANYSGLESVTKYNSLKNVYLESSHDAYYQAKREFAFPDSKAVKELILIQSGCIDDALAYAQDTIHENEKGFTSILEVKRMEITEVYDEAILREKEIFTDRTFHQYCEDLIASLVTL